MLNLSEICKHVENGVKCISDGEIILQSNFLVKYGRIPGDNSANVVLKGLCLQYSHRREKPFEITVHVNINEKKILDARCTYQAGASGKCKHSVALLLMLAKITYEEVPSWSCTDTPCSWLQANKTNVAESLVPKPLNKLCHPLRRSTMIYDFPEIENYFESNEYTILLNGNQSSAFAKHIRGRNTSVFNTIQELPTCDSDSFLAQCISSYNQAIPSEEYIFNFVTALSEEEHDFFVKYVCKSQEECVHIAQSSVRQSRSLIWKIQRKIRITASNSYELFTYNRTCKTNEQWEKKLQNMIFSKFKGNKFTKYGKEKEKVALSKLMVDVSKYGLIINRNVPYLGFSPDGIVKCNETYLVEVKCLDIGKRFGGNELCDKLKYLEVENNSYHLKKNCKYYGQIQTSLALSNLQNARLIIYSMKEDNIVNIPVLFDEDFATELFIVLSEVYFTRVLPFLCNHIRELNLED